MWLSTDSPVVNYASASSGQAPDTRHNAGVDVLERPSDASDRFIWRFGDTEVSVTWESPSWVVRLYANSRLGGPNALVSKRDFQQPTHAAFAIMTHVQRITLSEDEGVSQGRSAARWMRQQADLAKSR